MEPETGHYPGYHRDRGRKITTLFGSENRAGSERLLQYNWIHRVRSSRHQGKHWTQRLMIESISKAKPYGTFTKPATGAC